MHPLRPHARERRTTSCRRLLLLGALLLAGCGREETPTAPPPPAHGNYDTSGVRTGPATAATARPNVVLILIDTLRRDAVWGPGGGEAQMPFLASLGARGTAFRDVTAPASWTLPSLTSLLTGLAPHEHRCTLEGHSDLAAGVTTFAEVLQSGHGYQTRAFVGLPTYAAKSTVFQGFAEVSPEFSLQAVEAQVGPWAKARDPKRPFLLLLHTYDAHEPYGRENQRWPKPRQASAFEGGDPLDGVASDPAALTRLCLTQWRACSALHSPRHPQENEQVLRFLWSGLRDQADPQAYVEPLRRAYQEGTIWVDGLLRAAVEQLEAFGLLKDTVLVVTADHGEAFGEHGMLLHGRQVYDELVRVPLVIAGWGPFAAGQTVEGHVGLTDVFPTLLEAFRMPPLGEEQGRSALGLVEGDGPGWPVISQVRATPQVTGGQADHQSLSVRTARWKYILTADFLARAVREELYDLLEDPGETRSRPLASTPVPADVAAAVERVRDHLWRRGGAGTRLEPDLPDLPYRQMDIPRPPPLRTP